MIRFVRREKLRVSSPSCRGNLISRLDSDSDIRCEKRVVKTPQGRKPDTAEHNSGRQNSRQPSS